MATTITKGGEALYVYPAGDCDHVTVHELTDSTTQIELPDDRLIWVELEDIGIGVDEEIAVDWASFGMSIPEWYLSMRLRLHENEARAMHGDR
jgi:hypothetical protein